MISVRSFTTFSYKIITKLQFETSQTNKTPQHAHIEKQLKKQKNLRQLKPNQCNTQQTTQASKCLQCHLDTGRHRHHRQAEHQHEYLEMHLGHLGLLAQEPVEGHEAWNVADVLVRHLPATAAVVASGYSTRNGSFVQIQVCVAKCVCFVCGEVCVCFVCGEVCVCFV